MRKPKPGAHAVLATTNLGLIDAAESAALIGAGLPSVLILPVTGLALLRRGGPAPEPEPECEPAPMMAM